jgi:hypothetical protein
MEEERHRSAVVCLHGGPGLWGYIGSLAALLDDTFTVIRFEPRL